ncbi:TRS33-TRAPP subunit of 33 kDa involved in targeting and fusion of ER to golgi transp [Teratosphaeria destructans]|uniref:TRS33-TRAPP subunit of 33 kDa involved in targeting and fusion of ER to golgi transp n=1 Tax=Teratosphaeria destructans TaxID=418781 RepID=A0A9W7SYR6_9PEZI|nr:TRS33-TRAPP subunit of 33 kDa involved in targeting and fusion of ER to golgi transp [Teratosphaeria destructans]
MSRQLQPAEEDDPRNPKVAASALDFLLIELVPLAQRITGQLHAQEQAMQEEYRRSRLFNKTAAKRPANAQAGSEGTSAAAVTVADGSVKDSVAGTVATEAGTMTTLGFPAMDEHTREGVFWRLDGLGYRVGQGLVERFSVNKPRPSTPLDAIKFICKDLWTVVFRKQIDNLKTNHRGIFVLTDNRFQPLSRMSVDRRAGPKAADEAIARAQTYMYFPCGVLRGALAGLGIEATVEGSSAEIPAATFQIKTKGAKP